MWPGTCVLRFPFKKSKQPAFLLVFAGGVQVEFNLELRQNNPKPSNSAETDLHVIIMTKTVLLKVRGLLYMDGSFQQWPSRENIYLHEGPQHIFPYNKLLQHHLMEWHMSLHVCMP